jgi:4-amino-4-deoxy-L-arabinose transferase-like glycosyltransferase
MRSHTRPRFAARPVLGIALAAFGVLIVFAGGYGFHRDELYFMEAGNHPAWGYDDQPPLTPLIAAAATSVFGDTATGLRVPSELAFAICVVLCALMARELGGGTRAQIVAAASLAASSALFLAHIVSTATYDFLAWTVLLYIAVRLIARRDPRLWVAFGAVLGVGLLNKWLVLALVASLGAGLALSRDLALVRNRWALIGAAIALALWLPNLVWQADHGWPQQELADQIAAEDPTGSRLVFLPFQLLIVSPLLAPIWIAGLVWLLRRPAGRPFMAIGAGYLVLVGLCLLSAGKEYYAVGWYPALLAAGAVALERWLEPLRRRVLVGAGVAVSAAVSMVIALPVIPESSVGSSPVADLNEDVLETIGWPHFADTVAATWRSLTPAERARAVILTGNYGEAGAIQQFGPARGLPRAYSGHNSFSSFGRPPDGAQPVIAVGFSSPYLARFFRDCRVATRIDNGVEVDNEEQGGPVHVCGAPRAPWARLWPRLHHLSA